MRLRRAELLWLSGCAPLPVKDEAWARGLVSGQRADRERANDAGESDDERAHYEQESRGK